MHKIMHNIDVLFLLIIPKQDKRLSPCSCSALSLPGKGPVLVRFFHTVTGLRTLFLFLPFLDLLWNSMVPLTPYSEQFKCFPVSSSTMFLRSWNPNFCQDRLNLGNIFFFFKKSLFLTIFYGDSQLVLMKEYFQFLSGKDFSSSKRSSRSKHKL